MKSSLPSHIVRLGAVIFVSVSFLLGARDLTQAQTVQATCQVVVNAQNITCNLTANPSPLVGGRATTFTWSSTGADTCVGNGFSTGGAVSGTSGTVTPAPGAPYQLTCTSSSGAAPCVQTLTALAPTTYIEAVPDRVRAGTSAVVRWSADRVSTCTVTRDGVSVWNTTLTLPNVTIATTTLSPDPTITKQTEFAISCDGAAASDTVLINVVPTIDEF